jgi:hypothetical protein
MPRVTYGLVQGMISHRITSPDPAALVGRDDQPDACTQCHVDRSRSWAAEGMAALGLRGGQAAASPSVEESWGSRVLLDLYGGDPLQRVLAADALAQTSTPVDAELRMRWLLGALEDEYPAVRFAAARGLARVASDAAPELTAKVGAYDFLAPVDVRLGAVDALREVLGEDPFTGQEERRRSLLEHQERQLLWIGE